MIDIKLIRDNKDLVKEPVGTVYEKGIILKVKMQILHIAFHH